MSVLTYSLLRVLLLISFGGLAFALGMRGILLLIAAFLGSGIISFFVLRPARERAGSQVGGIFRRLNNRIDAAAAAEDEVTLPNTSADQRTADSPRSS